MSSDAALTIDEMVYNPGASDNSALFSMTSGLFVLVSGDAARSGDMVVSTPVATIGIRGTAVAIQAASAGLQNVIVLLSDPNGNDGLAQVYNAASTVILEALGDSVSLELRDQLNLVIGQLTPEQIATAFGSALAIMQQYTGSDLGADEATFDDLSEEDRDALRLLFEELIDEASPG